MMSAITAITVIMTPERRKAKRESSITCCMGITAKEREVGVERAQLLAGGRRQGRDVAHSAHDDRREGHSPRSPRQVHDSIGFDERPLAHRRRNADNGCPRDLFLPLGEHPDPPADGILVWKVRGREPRVDDHALASRHAVELRERPSLRDRQSERVEVRVIDRDGIHGWRRLHVLRALDDDLTRYGSGERQRTRDRDR